jgi:hypothetical protein
MSIKRGQTGEKRDSRGRFVKGYSGGGRKPMPEDFKQLAAEHAKGALEVLIGIYQNPAEDATQRIAAAKVIIERAYGKPSQEITANLFASAGDFVLEIAGENNAPENPT